ncbi:potassium/proton antiporter [Thalassovita autumnalis]|uniref:Potassium/proton antiporter n=1 Tax=Thalassovita autumnalis TaxID=2072972 RepID=A0A0P1FN19_9RHOB|nr:sodium:proton antiporter [Thalassovita autumnalis]CUH69540.1 potassium/proton antiporter [Thalassovita autumnalis]CUH72943.1 potassium/proton antiporter [Thalassovita autumnalis]
MASPDVAGLSPINAIALVGALGVGAQWLAWRLQLPGIVLMLLAGVIAGPVLGILDPARDIGPLVAPMVSVAVAIILFEGGLTLNFHQLSDAATGVKRLVFVGAPLGWLTSAMALHYGAGLGWQASAVFGGIMIVTGPTVIAPLLRQAKLGRRPAALLQWEAIVNDPIGALAAVLAFELVVVLNTTETVSHAAQVLALGVVVATILGALGGYGIARAFKQGWVPEYMKVPVLFVVLIAIFAASDTVLHESGLLAVTIMGVVIANAELPSYTELRRFKEHATVLLVSGVFILLAASLDFSTLGQLNWRAALFVASVILLARPATVLISLLGTDLPWRERVLIAFTGPRGVVLVAVAGLFGERLAALGVADGALVAPLAFVLVAVTVVLHGFTLTPFARALGLTGAAVPGVLLVGGSRFSLALAQALGKAEVPVLIADPNRARLRAARQAGVNTFYGDVLSEAAEHNLELAQYGRIIALSDNDAYNTLVTTDLGPEFGRDNIFQLARHKGDLARNALPSSLGGRAFVAGHNFDELEANMRAGHEMRCTRLSDEYGLEEWQADAPEALIVMAVDPKGNPRLPSGDKALPLTADWQVIWLDPKGTR